jgi:CheY-like chemotaxis protein
LEEQGVSPSLYEDYQTRKDRSFSEGERASPSVPRVKSRHLLLVDDNPINMKLLTTVVRKLNHTFATASHGLEAVQLYSKSLEQQRQFDMVFMDISMPVMDGFQATREIRQMELEAGVQACKIVALTGLSSDASRNEAYACGSDLFFTKPVKLDKVRRLLDEEIDERN